MLLILNGQWPIISSALLMRFPLTFALRDLTLCSGENSLSDAASDKIRPTSDKNNGKNQTKIRHFFNKNQTSYKLLKLFFLSYPGSFDLNFRDNSYKQFTFTKVMTCIMV